MKDLTYYDPLASDALRRSNAIQLADQLDMIFRVGRGAKYEPDTDRTGAINKMVDVLLDADKTVKEFAASVDSAFRFWEETTNA